MGIAKLSRSPGFYSSVKTEKPEAGPQDTPMRESGMRRRSSKEIKRALDAISSVLGPEKASEFAREVGLEIAPVYEPVTPQEFLDGKGKLFAVRIQNRGYVIVRMVKPLVDPNEPGNEPEWEGKFIEPEKQGDPGYKPLTRPLSEIFRVPANARPPNAKKQK